jgi:hypothetical protein
MASGENFKLDLEIFFNEKKVGNLPRWEGFGRRDTLMGVDAPSYESEGEAAEGKQSIIELYAENGGRRHQTEGDSYSNDLTRRLLHLNHQEVQSLLDIGFQL